MCFLQPFKRSKPWVFTTRHCCPKGSARYSLISVNIYLLANVHLQPLQTVCPHAHVHIYLCLLLPRSSSVSKIGISVMSRAAGDNKLVEEPITSRWQAGGSGLSTCHYLHIDISKGSDRPFLRLPWRATMRKPEVGNHTHTPLHKSSVLALYKTIINVNIAIMTAQMWILLC